MPVCFHRSCCQAVQSVFGYAKAELEGANISLLMPQPFSQRHNGYLQVGPVELWVVGAGGVLQWTGVLPWSIAKP